MTDKQKQAISVLLRLTQGKHITDEEHILLLDFVIGDGSQPSPNIPWVKPGRNEDPFGPLTVMYGCRPDVISYDDNQNKNRHDD